MAWPNITKTSFNKFCGIVGTEMVGFTVTRILNSRCHEWGIIDPSCLHLCHAFCLFVGASFSSLSLSFFVSPSDSCSPQRRGTFGSSSHCGSNHPTKRAWQRRTDQERWQAYHASPQSESVVCRLSIWTGREDRRVNNSSRRMTWVVESRLARNSRRKIKLPHLRAV